MAEDERTIEDSVESSGGEAHSETVDAGESAVNRESSGPDDAAKSFFELDADLDEVASDDTRTSGGRRRGLVVDADRIERSAVPEGYPLDPATEQAIALTVDFGDDSTTVYLAWPDEGGNDVPLTWLLDAMGIELPDLYGREVAVGRVDGHPTLVAPEERPRGSGRWVAGVAGGHALVAGILGLLAATGGLSLPVFLLWLVLTFAWLPYVTYRDAWYLRTHSDWAGGPLFWTTLSALPVVNVFAGLAYLWQRSRATFFGEEPSLRRRVLGAMRSLVRS